MNLLDQEIIDTTTKKFAGDLEVANRILWWLRHGQSCERWFQFEWAYRLETVLKSEFPEAYSVGCERNFVDIVIYKSFKSSIPLYESSVSAGIEIKWCGNWSAANSIAETEKDLRKIRENIKYNYPALALSAWIFATPAEKNDPLYSWVAKQIKAEKVDQPTLKQKRSFRVPRG